MKSLFMLCLLLFHSSVYAQHIRTNDTSTICSASCLMKVDKGTSIRVVESRVFNRGGECGMLLPQWDICKKNITDTLTKEAFTIGMWDIQFPDQKEAPISEKYIGANHIRFYKARKRNEVLITIEPDNCTCQWVALFHKRKLPFVEKTLAYLSFTENP